MGGSVAERPIRHLPLLGAILLAAMGVWISFRIYTSIRLEDALITYRYAQNLARGEGFVFNSGEQVLGTTTPLFTLVLGLLGAVFGPEQIPLVSNVLMMSATAGAGLLTFLALRALGHDLMMSVFVLVVFCFHPEILWTTTGGMETPLVLLLMSAGFYSLARGSYLAAAALSALLVLTRIDGLFWALGIYTVILIRDRRALGKSILVGATIILPWVLFAFYHFGSPVPHSVIAKRTIGTPYDLLALPHLVEYVRWVAPFLASVSPFGTISGLVFFAAGAWSVWQRELSSGLALMAGFPFIFTAALYAGKAPLYFDWYLAPVGYAALVVGAIGLWNIVDWAARLAEGYGVGKRLLHIVGGFFLVAYFALLGQHGRQTAVFHRDYQINEDSTRRAVGEWLKAATPPEAVVAMEAVGYQAYYSDRQVIDLAGLVSPSVVAIKQESFSNADAFHRILTTLRPDYLVLRSLEVDRNIHFHGGRLFQTHEHMASFAAHYEEVKRFEAPLKELWGETSYLTVFQRRAGLP